MRGCNPARATSYRDIAPGIRLVLTAPMLPQALVAASLRPFILSILADGASYGYELIQRVHALTEGQIRYTTSTLYPVLHDLENRGLLESFWQATPNAPRRKYYRLTPKGQKALATAQQQWLHVHGALMKLWGPELSLG